MSSPHVEVERIGRSGHLILNRPRALNALDLPMIERLQQGLDALLADERVERIVIRSSNPRAFSAGGDMRHIRDRVLAGDIDGAMAFFRAEFALNLAISRVRKPYVSLIQGICMGGGLGLSVHGAYRVVGEGARLAMPETAIGYFTDVGGTHFLNRLPGRTGLWLGLTAAHITAEDAVALGIGTHLVADDAMPAILDALCHDAACVPEILGRHHLQPRRGFLQENAALVTRLFGHSCLDDILSSLERSGEDFARLSLDNLRSRSPHALNLTFDLLRRGRSSDLATCLENEFAALPAVLQHPDFAEGVRSVLVDKDRSPTWHSRHSGSSVASQVSTTRSHRSPPRA